MPKVLVTGGAGYVGSVLVPALQSRGHAAEVIDLRLGADCRDEGRMREALRSADAVIPLAGVVGFPACDRAPDEARSVNYEAIRLLCRLASPRQMILFPSTESTYGKNERVCTEESPLRPLSLYAKTKVDAEKAVLDRGHSLTFRFATAFGVSPRMRDDLLVNDFTKRAVAGETVAIFEGRFHRSFVHVQDMAAAFLHGIEKFEALKGRPYNCGMDAANVTKLELCEKIRAQVPGFQFCAEETGTDPDQRDYLVSSARLKSAGFEASRTLESGIAELAAHYK